MNSLVIGGTSGLGLEVAKLLAAEGDDVIVTGRHDPNTDIAEFRMFDLTAPDLPRRMGSFILDMPPVRTLVYAAGFYQTGHITELTDQEVDEMIDVCGRGLIFSVKKLLEKQGSLRELITITSTSEWTPREFEPVYNFAKAGAGHYANAQAMDPAVGKTLKVGVAGMTSGFWKGTDKDTSNMLEPDWVAQRIMEERTKVKSFRPIRILGPRDKQRVKVDTDQER